MNMAKQLFLLCFMIIFSGCSSKPKINPRQAKIYSKMGATLLVQGEYPAALQNLLMANEIDSKDPVTHNNLGLAYLARGKYDSAEKHLLIALELNPEYTDAQNNLGRIYIRSGKYSKAVRILREASKNLTYLAPEKTYSNLGIAYFKNKQYSLARKTLKRSLQIRRKSCQTQNYYGRTLYKLREYDIATRAFDAAMPLCLKEKFDQPYYFGALSYNQTGRHEKTKALLEELIKTYPESIYKKQAESLLENLKKAL